MGTQRGKENRQSMEQKQDSVSTRRGMRARLFIAGLGSLFDLWPVVDYEEVYPHKAEDIHRRSQERVAAALWTAYREVTGEQEEGKEGQAKAQEFKREENTADEPFNRR